MRRPIARYSVTKPSVVYPLSPDSSASRRLGSRVRIRPPWDLRRQVLWHVFAGWRGQVGPGVGRHAALRLIYAVRMVRAPSPEDGLRLRKMAGGIAPNIGSSLVRTGSGCWDCGWRAMSRFMSAALAGCLDFMDNEFIINKSREYQLGTPWGRVFGCCLARP